MSQVTQPSSWALLLCACAKRSDRLSVFFFSFPFGSRKTPPDAGHGKRESAPATIPGCHVFPVLKPSCPAFANRGNGGQDRFQTNAAGGTPATASHARMTMTVAGLPSRRQERDAFPLSVAPPFSLSCGALRHSHHSSSFSFPPLQVYANVPMPPFQTASVVIFVAGAR